MLRKPMHMLGYHALVESWQATHRCCSKTNARTGTCRPIVGWRDSPSCVILACMFWTGDEARQSSGPGWLGMGRICHPMTPSFRGQARQRGRRVGHNAASQWAQQLNARTRPQRSEQPGLETGRGCPLRTSSRLGTELHLIDGLPRANISSCFCQSQ
jgi:hypothetical protein